MPKGWACHAGSEGKPGDRCKSLMPLEVSMYENIWIDSEYDIVEDSIDPGHRRSARIKYRSLRLTSHSAAYAREVILARWGW